MERFLLDEISKIDGATPSKRVLDFLWTLDKYLEDDINHVVPMWSNILRYQELREDIVQDTEEQIKNCILQNAPDSLDYYIRVQ